MTQDEVAFATGLTQAAISRLERGVARRIDFGTLERLCEAFGLDPEHLFEWEEGRNPSRAPAELWSQFNNAQTAEQLAAAEELIKRYQLDHASPLAFRLAIAELESHRLDLSPAAQHEIDQTLARLRPKLEDFERRFEDARRKKTG